MTIKNNFYKEDSTILIMKKRGEAVAIFAVVAFVAVAGSILAGSYLLTQNNLEKSLENKYVGDIKTKKVYEIKCINHIAEENRIFFESYTKAKKLQFYYSAECLK